MSQSPGEIPRAMPRVLPLGRCICATNNRDRKGRQKQIHERIQVCHP